MRIFAGCSLLFALFAIAIGDEAIQDPNAARPGEGGTSRSRSRFAGSSTADSVALPNGGTLPAPLELGRQLYDQNCAACHGVTGEGNGPATVWLFPRPRNFTSGLFKIQSTPAGSLPTDDDLFRTITRGMPGSSMPSFSYLSEAERRDIVQYVKFLTAEVGSDGKRRSRFDEQAAGSVKPVEVPPEPPVTIQALTQGKELFAKLACATCHGETGAGDGPSSATLKDNWGMPLLPRDFNIGAFRGGHTGRDLYLRIHNGMAGTPMPPFGEGIIAPEERWALVLYIQSLRRKDIEVNDILAPEDNLIHVRRVHQLPADPMDRFWESIDPVRVPLNPLWPEPYPIPAVAVTAVYDGLKVAIFCQWRDEIFNGAPVRIQDFQDAMAMQFSLTEATPFLGMGDATNQVNLWMWKAGWQQSVDGQHQDMLAEYNSMHVDFYFAHGTQTASDAGNLNALRSRSPVEEANARGFGTLTPQSAARQNVQGKGIWHDGFWNVVFIRDLESRDADDVNFAKDRAIPVAFAVWNGEQRDRNGRKVISNWYQLVLEP